MISFNRLTLFIKLQQTLDLKTNPDYNLIDSNSLKINSGRCPDLLAALGLKAHDELKMIRTYVST